MKRLTIPARISLGVIAAVILAAVFAPLLAPHSAYTQFALGGGPSADHWMGLDSANRDIFTRLLYGARWSLIIGLGATVLALIAGAILGALAATSKRWADESLMRSLDVIMAFPGIALAAVLVAVFGGGIPVLVLAIAFLYTPSVARVVRANVLAQYGEDYVAAERIIGARTPYIVIKHVAINCAAPVLVFCTVMVADAIVFEASLSFIGAGVRPPDPSWGSVIADGRNMVLLGGWWATVFPGLLILITVLCLNILAEGVSDAWAAPVSRPATAHLPAWRRMFLLRSSDAMHPVNNGLPQPPAPSPHSTGAAVPLPAAPSPHSTGAAVPLPTASSPNSAGIASPVSTASSPHAERLAVPRQSGSPLNTAGASPNGPGGVLPLAGLAEAAQRLGERARTIPAAAPVLDVSDLTISFKDRHNGVNVVDRVSFSVRPGEVLGLVGESGCGKSLTALTVMGLEPKGANVSGTISFRGRNLLTLTRRERRRHLGHEMAMVYQDALSSLNPAMTIRAQLKQVTRRGGRNTPAELLEQVGLDPARTLSAYPHELSGGQRQRVLIAMALSRRPKLIVADEPTTALDVTVQAQVIELLLRLQAELGFALILVSHDLALVADITDRVVVMYGGQIAETGRTATVVGAPAHHYARGLLGSVLSLESGAARLTQIRGVVPSPADFPQGCRFADRCPMATDVCATEAPALQGDIGAHAFACHHPALTLAEAR